MANLKIPDAPTLLPDEADTDVVMVAKRGDAAPDRSMTLAELVIWINS